TPLWEAPSGHPANPPAALQGHTSLPRCQEEPGRDPQSSLPQITAESSSVSEGSLPSWSSGPAGAQGASHEGTGSSSDGKGDGKAATDRVGSATDTVLQKHPKITFYILVKAIYTLGYSVSLMSLATGSIILCLFRKLHCTRNYIHLNLFLSFILRAISVLVKDDVLYSSSGTLHCPNQPSSWVGCKLSLVFLQYCIMANFFWLLVEGLYLHTLLVAVLPPGRCFLAYLLIGWGLPTVCIGAWTAARLYLEDTGCWDTNDHSVPWWVIRIPILISIIVNFVLFISIIRILLQKLTSPDVGGNDQSQYKRLAKSTLLLIPLFGVHYMVFAVFPISISSKYQILFELCLGSFQGLVVAVLYCFLNSEVQCELKRKWRSRCPTPSTSRDYRACGSSISRHGSEGALQLQRGCRAPSFLQTETSGL
uniref:G-protein coupled receptors family 2 profile 2 domain-containing protein n=1 Tax=Colobus angolensis palliatus TaxID=336983 RepID=A0A2K5IRL9_COLAP